MFRAVVALAHPAASMAERTKAKTCPVVSLPSSFFFGVPAHFGKQFPVGRLKYHTISPLQRGWMVFPPNCFNRNRCRAWSFPEPGEGGTRRVHQPDPLGIPGEIYGVNPAGGEVLGGPPPGHREAPRRRGSRVFVISPRRSSRRSPPGGKGMKAAIVISAGFKEIGGEGAPSKGPPGGPPRRRSVRSARTAWESSTPMRDERLLRGGSPPPGRSPSFRSPGPC